MVTARKLPVVIGLVETITNVLRASRPYSKVNASLAHAHTRIHTYARTPHSEVCLLYVLKRMSNGSSQQTGHTINCHICHH